MGLQFKPASEPQHIARYRPSFSRDLIRTSIYDKHSGATKIAAHLDHISRCKMASGTDWSNGWTYRVFVISTCLY